MSLSSCRAKLHAWYDGWSRLARHREIPGYRDLPWPQRVLLDHRAALRAVATRGLWRALFMMAVAATVAQILIWRHDLSGWHRDALYLLPTILAAPWMANGRRTQIGRLLAKRRLRRS